MIENNDFSYCVSCENRKMCFENHWVVTMDKDREKCDNFEIRKDVKESLNAKN